MFLHCQWNFRTARELSDLQREIHGTTKLHGVCLGFISLFFNLGIR